MRITWDEAFATMGEKFNDVKERYGGESLFAMLGTSRVWSMAGAMAFRQLFNTPNNIAAFEICKGPRHMATMMISEMAFSWQAIVEHPRVYVQWGGASEISNYDDSGRMTVDVAKSADYHIVVDPRTTNLSTNADIHLALRPGTDGAMALSWARCRHRGEALRRSLCASVDQRAVSGRGGSGSERVRVLHQLRRYLRDEDASAEGERPQRRGRSPSLHGVGRAGGQRCGPSAPRKR